MKRLGHRAIGIDQGDVILFSDFEHDGVMWTGDGPRQTRAHVQFSDAFLDAPSVIVGLSMWDMSNIANARADVTTEDVTAQGFAILFRTWGDSKIARVRVRWQAIGPVEDEEIWSLD
ncbi:MAG: hypothetical protein GW886_13135 [Rhodobacterales bacterium]|nr:hypothetical protein [Rhodobacterales bacterium]NCT12125.1 hypothetical protein [Rhodobacterales bacterium]